MHPLRYLRGRFAALVQAFYRRFPPIQVLRLEAQIQRLQSCLTIAEEQDRCLRLAITKERLRVGKLERQRANALNRAADAERALVELRQKRFFSGVN